MKIKRKYFYILWRFKILFLALGLSVITLDRISGNDSTNDSISENTEQADCQNCPNGSTDQEINNLSNAVEPEINVPLTGLTRAYLFNEGYGTTAYDSAGTNQNGTIYGASWTTGKVSNGLNFDGINDYVSIPKINPTGNFSISAWFYKYANDWAELDTIFGGNYYNSNLQYRQGYTLRFHNNSPDAIGFTLITMNADGYRTEKIASYKSSNSVGSWHYVVGTYNTSNGQQKLYVDGVLRNTQYHQAGNTIVPLTTYSNMIIGRSTNGIGFFYGVIDEVVLYNRVLSATEVQTGFDFPGSYGPKGLSVQASRDLDITQIPENNNSDSNVISATTPTPYSREEDTLLSFQADVDNDGSVTLMWETFSEVDIEGFNLYRSRLQNGKYLMINDAVIPAKGSNTSGAIYSFLDSPEHGKYYYRLESINSNGLSTMHNSVKARTTSKDD